MKPIVRGRSVSCFRFMDETETFHDDPAGAQGSRDLPRNASEWICPHLEGPIPQSSRRA